MANIALNDIAPSATIVSHETEDPGPAVSESVETQPYQPSGFKIQEHALDEYQN